MEALQTPRVPLPKLPLPKLPQPTQTGTAPIVPTTVVIPKPIMPKPSPMVQTRIVVPQTKQPGTGLLRQFGGGGQIVIAATPQVTAVPTVATVEETGYTILVKMLDAWEGSVEQTQQLANLRYIDGTPIIDVKRRDIIREIIGMLIYQPFEEVIDFLKDAPNPEYILWDQESMDEGRTKVAREIAIQQAEEVGVKGVGRCRYCPSTELVYAMKQLRSGDEPATIFVRCVMCNKQWRQ